MPAQSHTRDSKEGKASQKPPLARQVQEGLGEQLQQAKFPAAVERAATAPRPAVPPADILALQRTYGNRAVQRLLASRAQRQIDPPSPIQPKLTVGPVGDKYEQEADRVARQVVSEVDQPGSPPEGSTAAVQRTQPTAEDELQTKRQAAPPVQRQIEEDEEATQLKPAATRPAANGSFEAGGEVESQLAGLRGRGRPLPAETRTRMEPRFGSDFGAVRIHTSSEAAQLNRALQAQAFTHGSDIYFGAGRYDPGSTSGQQLLAHELTHVIQQTGGVRLRRYDEESDWTRPPAAAIERGVQRASLSGVIQRHASWEHKMLGDVTADDLVILGAGRDVLKAEKKRSFWDRREVKVKVKIGDQETEITKADVLHVLEQEIERLKFFRDSPPQAATPEEAQRLQNLDLEWRKQRARQEAKEKVKQEHGITIRSAARARKAAAIQAAVSQAEQQVEASPRWQVRLVSIPHESGGETVVTYGELNTLGDFVGNPEQLSKIEASKLHAIVQGIRQESLLKFMRLHDEISGKSAIRKFLTQDKWGEGFDDAAGNTGRGDLTGELRLMYGGKTTVEGREETGYSAGLARNACHFAPFSWHAWARYHQKARDLAKLSHQLKQLAEQKEQQIGQVVDAEQKKKLKEEADAARGEAARFRREALIQNGYGDHFLQDSYAAGHLINKDEIMKWYVEWLHNTTTAVDYMRDATLQRMLRIAQQQPDIGATQRLYDKARVGQDQPKDIQSVENSGLSYLESFRALGLQTPPSVTPADNNAFKLTYAWQKKTLENPAEWAEITPRKGVNLMAAVQVDDLSFPILTRQQIEPLLQAMVSEGVAERKRKRWKGVIPTAEYIYWLKSGYVPAKRRDIFNTPLTQIISPNGSRPGQQAQTSYQTGAASVTYEAYHEFMNSAVVQAATNILHDEFCASGLDVKTRAGEKAFKIYGDNAMLQAESSVGLKHSATTSNMSRDSIYQMVDSDDGQAPHTLEQIRDRFPEYVVWEGSEISLADWHTQGTLKKFCHDGIFRKANASIKTFGGGISGGNLAGVVSGYQRVHGDEAF